MPSVASFTPSQALEAAYTCFQHTDLHPIAAVQVGRCHVEEAPGMPSLPPPGHQVPPSRQGQHQSPQGIAHTFCTTSTRITITHSPPARRSSCASPPASDSLLMASNPPCRFSKSQCSTAQRYTVLTSDTCAYCQAPFHTLSTPFHTLPHPCQQITKAFRLSRCTYVELLRAPANGPQYVDLRFSPAGCVLLCDTLVLQ